MSCNKQNSIKQGTTFKLSVEFAGGTDFSLDDVSKIEFVFKKQRSKDAEAIKVAEYPTNCSRVGETNVILVPFTEAETYEFPEGQPFYMDTRIYLSGSAENLPTNIVELIMGDTLFEELIE